MKISLKENLTFTRDSACFLYQLHQTYGDIALLEQGQNLRLFVFTPEYNRQVLGDATTFHTIGTRSPDVCWDAFADG